MRTAYEEVRIRGRDTLVPAARIGGHTMVAIGSWVRLAQVKDEELIEGDVIDDPRSLVELLKRSELRADVFTFAERPPRITPRYEYHVEWDNWAVAPITTFEEWWKHRLPRESRKNVRRAGRCGVVVRSVPFGDELVSGIARLYNETAVRQGRRFWHYGKDLDAVKRVNATYLERSEFIGAFLGSELIGFVKLVYVDHIATLMQVLAMNAQRDKRPMNALLAHAVKACERRKLSFLVYGRYRYGSGKVTSLTEFKRRNGFEEIRFPRYYVPLNRRGKLAIRLGLHRPVRTLLPGPAREFLRGCRSQLNRVWPRRGRGPEGRGVLSEGAVREGRSER
ncbi:MAG TPA: hypothetical protein VMS64_17560 [Candidatus Methylomirabilis sp.]|nr:hypothetical protein [Candidatus Methylomirabilis sp.]